MNCAEIAKTYKNTGAQGANKLELVALLYDVLLDDLRRAVEAVRAGEVERRTSEIQHAMQVLEQLQGHLDLDRGGEVARQLDRLYSWVRGKLLEAQWKSSREILQEQIELLKPIRDAWRQVSTTAPTAAISLPSQQPAAVDCQV